MTTREMASHSSMASGEFVEVHEVDNFTDTRDENSVDSTSRMRLYAAKIVAARRTLLCVFGTTWAVSCFQAPAMFTNVDDQLGWDVLDGTGTKRARDEFNRYFPDLVDAKTESLLIWSDACPSLVDGECGEAVKRLINTANASLLKLDAASDRGWVKGVKNYYDYPVVMNKSPFLSEDKKTMLFQWTWKFPASRSEDAAVMANKVFSHVAQLSRKLRLDIQTAWGGPVAAHQDVVQANIQDSGVHAIAFLPISLGIFCFRVGSLTLALVPVITAVGSIVTSFAIGSLVCIVIPVNSMAPALMSFFTIALSVDYSLFLLTRYADERRAGSSWRPALETMLVSSGGVVLVSGAVISVASLSGAVLPGGFRGVALVSTVSCVSCMAWNVLIVPAIIASAPTFFDCCSSWPKASELQLRDDSADADVFRCGSPSGRIHSFEASPDLIVQELAKSKWFWWASQVTRWPVNLGVLIAVLVLCMPLVAAFWEYQPSIDTTTAEPRGASSTFVNERIRSEFSTGVGCPSPIYVLLVPRHAFGCPAVVRSNGYFSSSCQLMQNVISNTSGKVFEIDARNVMGISFFPKSLSAPTTELSCISWEVPFSSPLPVGKSLLSEEKLPGMLGVVQSVYKKLWPVVVSADETASVVAIAPTLDPTTTQGFQLVESMQAEFEALRALAVDGVDTAGCKLDGWIMSDAAAVWDFVSVTLQELPKAVVGSMVFAFLFVACRYSAIFLPVKLFLTVTLPIIWSYGVAVLIYQNGLLSGLGVDALQSKHGLIWQIPVCTCTMLFGLALDYDVFLFSRIWELRAAGYGNLDAVRLGVAGTASTLTSAGLIFIFEFSGALLSSVPASNQIGAVIMIAVLIDISIVELCFVPAMLSLGADLNWWPTPMPEPVRSVAQDLQGGERSSSIFVFPTGDMCGLLHDPEAVPMLHGKKPNGVASLMPRSGDASMGDARQQDAAE
eukprot:TRINITY_DN2950_c0_g1_i1.p1 TRINITY_DN2950_c0_g1~~TRINITY_DN2950_c0_g1_i1.p1  ORF type:complete len:956 (+),score=158.52 TRINITY_DN2950_c0_g1_i1:123-2990(+)